jgi:undecaprenyl pyrophosphate synthase
MPKRKCSFTEDLQKEFAFLRKSKLNSEVNCTQCNVTFSVSHGGRSDIKDHMKSSRHKKAVEGLASKGSYFSCSIHYKSMSESESRTNTVTVD